MPKSLQAEKPQAQIRQGTAGGLWDRAPAFRAIVYVAASVSLVGVIALAFDYRNPVQIASSSPDDAKTVHQPSQLASPVVKPDALRPAQQAVPSKASEPAPLPVPNPAVADQAAASASEEEAQLARCHPHLIPATAAMPQIDVGRMADPSLGHVKVHFWVNGAGLVTREVLTSTTYATEAERQAELDFTKGLTFTVPNTAQCRVREMELIGDFFEMRNPSGQWATFVRLYPRLSFDTDGIVRSRE